ncbi:hypothetical protein CIRG_02611 [Coccidioides immitis RMSCC 2394]|uniref:Uncharacterized protein n=1 Tax=Coccidioides immitis RMSCC 2394 TaxID=404692 RepID=A0A0J6Y885_COCIT|nr:hypothetical protein CIRG_02611 [Coccidioides immitis RMSCC 2394]
MVGFGKVGSTGDKRVQYALLLLLLKMPHHSACIKRWDGKGKTEWQGPCKIETVVMLCKAARGTKGDEYGIWTYERNHDSDNTRNPVQRFWAQQILVTELLVERERAQSE